MKLESYAKTAQKKNKKGGKVLSAPVATVQTLSEGNKRGSLTIFLEGEEFNTVSTDIIHVHEVGLQSGMLTSQLPDRTMRDMKCTSLEVDVQYCTCLSLAFNVLAKAKDTSELTCQPTNYSTSLAKPTQIT